MTELTTSPPPAWSTPLVPAKGRTRAPAANQDDTPPLSAVELSAEVRAFRLSADQEFRALLRRLDGIDTELLRLVTLAREEDLRST